MSRREIDEANWYPCQRSVINDTSYRSDISIWKIGQSTFFHAPQFNYKYWFVLSRKLRSSWIISLSNQGYKYLIFIWTSYWSSTNSIVLFSRKKKMPPVFIQSSTLSCCDLDTFFRYDSRPRTFRNNACEKLIMRKASTRARVPQFRSHSWRRPAKIAACF